MLNKNNKILALKFDTHRNKTFNLLPILSSMNTKIQAMAALAPQLEIIF